LCPKEFRVTLQILCSTVVRAPLMLDISGLQCPIAVIAIVAPI